MSYPYSEETIAETYQDSERCHQSLGSSYLPKPQGMLLTMGNYFGTLAAARDLDSCGVPVILADSQRLSLAAVSCHISRYEKTPSIDNLEAFYQWLIEFGQKEPGYVLYPTSDEMCLLIIKYRQELSRYYYLYQSPGASIYELLNKEKLFKICQSLSVDCPRTWFPNSEAEQHRLASIVKYPVLVKPKTQAGMAENIKGIICHSKKDFLDTLARFNKPHSYRQETLKYDPSLARLVVQEFHPEAAENIYSLAGFSDPENDIYVLRASEKVLQQPVKIGIGLCFESREIYDKPASQLKAILEKTGYKGAFEVEFIHLKEEDRLLLIDFNPRFYGQMGFEAARDLPIARLCYFAAIGEHQKVQEIYQVALDWDHSTPWKYSIFPMLRFFSTTQHIGGHMPKSRQLFWLNWSKTGQCYDPIYHSDDPMPGWAYMWQCCIDFMRHPRSTFRKYFSA